MDEDGSARRHRRHTQVNRGHPTGNDLIWPLLINPAAYRSLSVSVTSGDPPRVSQPKLAVGDLAATPSHRRRPVPMATMGPAFAGMTNYYCALLGYLA